MDFSQFLVPGVVVGCLVIGYCLKRIEALKINDYIPTILALSGAIIGGLLNGFYVETVIAGAISGLASTGLHQAFTRFMDGLSGEVGSVDKDDQENNV
ncbi:phage holin family protein [Enterococcus asini]|uniref:phage holin family protein n=1 Tax=Enterococcus asini TaxID=57732 RepID=UPI0026DA8110|nr:phage holin family protein [Enterococcus asini]